ncbi:MAG: hypothetical protein WC756_17660 [Taibaiella sp.]|jgi:hypothetical protein
MYSLDYTQCGCPRNTGINLSTGSNPYTPIPNHAINIVLIELGGTIYLVNLFFLTIDLFISWLNTEFVEIHGLDGYFFINQYNDLLYSNPEDFPTGSLIIADLSNVVLTMELSSASSDLVGFEAIMSELTGYPFIPENV